MPDPDLCPSFYKKDAGADAADAGEDAADAGEVADATADGPIEPACAGLCIPLAPAGWNPPTLLWIGSESQAPPCPMAASQLGYEGHADLNAPNVCGECRCDKPTGACGLPATLTANSTVCPGSDPGAEHTPFDPPGGWDGTCTTNEAIPADPLCATPACAQSITIAPLTMNEAGCAPSQLSGPANPPPSWDTFARMCEWEPHGVCATSGERCAPPVPPGFHVCVFQSGDNECADAAFGPYQERHVFYKGFHDTRSCSPCTCGSPSGGMCSASVSIFSDNACTSTPPLDTATVTSSAPICHDVPAGSALSRKSASPAIYTPGACEPTGGQPMGSVEPVGTATLCCIPSP
jgi:hypothetical protein